MGFCVECFSRQLYHDSGLRGFQDIYREPRGALSVALSLLSHVDVVAPRNSLTLGEPFTEIDEPYRFIALIVNNTRIIVLPAQISSADRKPRRIDELLLLVGQLTVICRVYQVVLSQDRLYLHALVLPVLCRKLFKILPK